MLALSGVRNGVPVLSSSFPCRGRRSSWSP
jgi:hypothetical protein